MANLKDLRTRITSVSSTMQITSAMKMVSAAKLKRAQDAIVQMRPYSQKLTLLMGNVSSVVDSSENLFFKKGQLRNYATTRVCLSPLPGSHRSCVVASFLGTVRRALSET